MPAIPFSSIAKIEPAPAWRFNVDFPALANSIASSTSLQTALGSSQLGFLVQSFNLSHRKIEVEQVSYNAGPRWFPTGHTWEALTIVFSETDAYTILQFYNAWRALAVDFRGNFGLPKDYLKTIAITPLTVRGGNGLVHRYQDVFPTGIDGYNYDGSATGHIAPSITFSVNTVIDPNSIIV